jgi:hypothetical protein
MTTAAALLVTGGAAVADPSWDANGDDVIGQDESTASP